MIRLQQSISIAISQYKLNVYKFITLNVENMLPGGVNAKEYQFTVTQSSFMYIAKNLPVLGYIQKKPNPPSISPGWKNLLL